MEARLRQALLQAEEVARALADPAVGKEPEKLRSLGREHTRLAPVVRLAERLTRLQDEMEQARSLAEEPDPELVALAKEDVARLSAEISEIIPEIPTTTAMPSWRSVPVLVETKRRSSVPTSTACTSDTASDTVSPGSPSR